MANVLRTRDVKQWLTDLKDRRDAGRITASIDNLEFALGDIEPVGEGVSELRLHFGPGYRVYFFTEKAAVFVLLCGTKRTQDRDIRKAKSMKKQE